MDYLEKTLGDSADKHLNELQKLKDAHSKHDAAHGRTAKKLDALRAAQQHHATIAERINYPEQN